MKAAWMIGLLLLVQQVNAPGEAVIQHEGQRMATAVRNEYTLPGQSMVDGDRLGRLMDELDRKMYRAPENARIGANGRIEKEQPGYRLNRTAFEERFYSYFYGTGPSVIDLPRTALYPKVDSELLANVRVKPIGHYVTYYNSNNKNRMHNISTAVKAINNHVLFPGELFSFNQVVGERTEKRGYLKAPVIVRGELAEGIGGGICQVSSTLFNAADRAGMHIVQRYSHSRNVPYVLPGRDATVSWNGPDFTFMNKYNQPVLIRAFTGGGSLFVSLYSSDVIEYKPREVPSTAVRIPEEISIETDADDPDGPLRARQEERE
ncbi:MAG: hypothetical protein K0Q94_2477 [Paenibacillus sp.]|nr:hypothetical protein [Paenibacillus sp.]